MGVHFEPGGAFPFLAYQPVSSPTRTSTWKPSGGRQPNGCASDCAQRLPRSNASESWKTL
jgi:hypothetical protein